MITSRFGVAGTLLGAALTTMIITGGSAILKSYLENVTGNVRKVPRKFRARREQRKAQRYAEPETLPERPDLKDNFAGRMRAALDWFSHLPPLTRRSILVKGLIAAAVAFVISMGAVFAVEKGIGNSLSCGLWSKCPDGAKPGIHLPGDRDAGTGSSLTLGRAKTKTAPVGGSQAPAYRQNGVDQDRFNRQERPGNRQPAADSGVEPRRGGVIEPEEPGVVPRQQETPSSASPAPEEEPGQEVVPSSASPAPSP